jgi:large conductance mechanosensitive channel
MALPERVAPVWRETRGYLDEFRAFIRRGNVIDLAVGVIMGAAFGKIVSSLVGDILMPPIGYALGNVDFKDLVATLRPEAPGKPAIVVSYGKFLQAVIDFVIIASCVFFLVKVVNRLHGPTAEPPKAPSDEVKLLTEIRDLLKTGPTGSTAPPPAAT